MTKSLKLALTSLAALIIVGVLITPADSLSEPLKSFVPPLLHHLMLTCQGLSIGGFLLWIFEESLAEKFGPIMTSGFRSIGESLAGKMVGQGSIAEGLASSLEKLADGLAPAVGQLVREGKIQEAIETVDARIRDDREKSEQEIAVLLHSEDPRDWEKALRITSEHTLSFRYYLTVAYRYWTSGNIGRATEVAEEGFSSESERAVSDGALVGRFKNSLAYYYAEVRRPDKEKISRQYAKEASEARPKDPVAIDTLGFVLISYGKTNEEIKQGIDYCCGAWSLGGISLDELSKHIERAKQQSALYV